MSEPLTLDEITQKCMGYFDTGENLQTAYDLLTEAAPRFPEQAMLIYNWRYCAAALLNKADLAIELLQESFDAGFWWSEAYLRSDDDLKSLQDLPAFNKLVDEFEQRNQAAQAESEPFSLALPLPAQKIEALPLLLALHGNGHNADDSAEFWESAVGQGWLTVLLQSSQINGPDAYVWDDLELGGSEIKDHYDGLVEEHPISTEQIVIGGFSKGGEMAIWMTLMDKIPVAGFVAVNPGGPYINDIKNWEPILEKGGSLTEKRGYFVVGENDPNKENVKALYELLVSKGMACELVVSPEIAHDFPEDFNQILAQALKYLQE